MATIPATGLVAIFLSAGYYCAMRFASPPPGGAVVLWLAANSINSPPSQFAIEMNLPSLCLYRQNADPVQRPPALQ
jgi:hypothetical protein